MKTFSPRKVANSILIFISGLFLHAMEVRRIIKGTPLFRQVLCQNKCTPRRAESFRKHVRLRRILLWVSATIYAVGLFIAFVLGPLLMRFG
jgi:hypothetical protein